MEYDQSLTAPGPTRSSISGEPYKFDQVLEHLSWKIHPDRSIFNNDIPKEQAGFYPGWTGIGMESVIISRVKHMTYLDIHVMNNPIIWLVFEEQ